MKRFRFVTLLGIALAVAVLAFAWSALGPSTSVDASPQEGKVAAAAACCNPGVFTGTDNAGSFEDAIADAVSKAETCAGCCDQQISYRVTQITGLVGGITARNDITVEIVASW